MTLPPDSPGPRLEAGIQIHLPSYEGHPLPRLMQIATASSAAGFDQLWITDNLECRSNFVLLGSLARAATTKLGTAIMAQYFRSPVEAARALVTVSELLDGRELSVGLGTGNATTSRLVRMPAPVAFMRQTAGSLGLLLAGQEICVDSYPLLRDYFGFVPSARLHVAASPAGPVRLYGGGNGPRGLALAGELMDGLIFGWTTMLNATLGKLHGMLEIANESAARAGRAAGFCRVTELKISVAHDHAKARQFVRASCARRMLGLRARGYSNDDLERLGISGRELAALKRTYQAGGPAADLSELVTDAMIDACYIAGNPSYCAERMAVFLRDVVRPAGFHQVMFSELGPDPVTAVELIAERVLPLLAMNESP